jgi:HSP20 family protein
VKILVQDWGSSFERLGEELRAKISEVSVRGYFRSHGPQAWQPAVNVYEAADRWILCVDLAGMERKDIDVQYGDGVLTIRGVRAKPCAPELSAEFGVHLMEIDTGPFFRSITISGSVWIDGIRAWYRRGFLWILVPCRESEESNC